MGKRWNRRWVTGIVLSTALFTLSFLKAQEAAEGGNKVRKIREVLRFLEQTGNEEVLLTGEGQNKVVVVAPSLGGRVLCTGFEGVEGDTDSYILEDKIKKGAAPTGRGAVWSNFGGEERFWLAPEGGKFALFFREGEEQAIANYLIPNSLNSARFGVTAKAEDGTSVTFAAPIQLTNSRGMRFDFQVKRKIEVLQSCPYALGYGDKLDFVGFESKSWVKNGGRAALSRQTGAVAVWTLGQYPVKDHTVIIVPFRPGPNSELGKPLNTQYFKTDVVDITKVPKGRSYNDYWTVKDNYALIKANGSIGTKIEMWPQRALGRIASIDLASFSLTIVEFRMYPRLDYLASYWLPYSGDPFQGAAISIFVLGKGAGIPLFYELETLSPALFLHPSEEYCHISRTYHLRGEKVSIGEILGRHFNVDLGTLQEFDRNTP